MEPQDDKAACLDLAKKIEDDVQVARKHRIINTCLQVVLMLMVATNFWRSIIISRTMTDSFRLVTNITKTTLETQARQDIYRQQYLDYIKDMIHTMQRFQDENPSLVVPKAPTPRLPVPPSDGDVNEYDLQRIPQTRNIPGPKPTPVVKTKTVIRYKSRPTPKPKTPLDWFKQTR